VSFPDRRALQRGSASPPGSADLSIQGFRPDTDPLLAVRHRALHVTGSSACTAIPPTAPRTPTPTDSTGWCPASSCRAPYAPSRGSRIHVPHFVDRTYLRSVVLLALVCSEDCRDHCCAQFFFILSLSSDAICEAFPFPSLTALLSLRLQFHNSPAAWVVLYLGSCALHFPTAGCRIPPLTTSVSTADLSSPASHHRGFCAAQLTALHHCV